MRLSIVAVMLLGFFVSMTSSPVDLINQINQRQFEQSGLSWKVAVVFSTSDFRFDSYNDQVYQALLKAKNRWRVDFEYSEPTSNSEYESHLRDFLENPSYSEPYDLIISIGFYQSSALEEVAGDYPDQNFAIVDYCVDSVTYPNVASLLFDTAEGSALVGAVAGLTTHSDEIGFIGGMDIPIVNNYEDGFHFGANYTNPMVDGSNFTVAYTNDWTDTTKGQMLADAMYLAGIDIIYTAAERAGLGAYTSAKNHNNTVGYDNPLWVIGGNYAQMKDGCADPDNPVPPTVGLTSMIRNSTPGIMSIVSHVLNGTFSGGNKSLNVENGGVHIELQPDLLELPQGVLDEVEDMRKGIANGSIVVPSSVGGVTLTERDVPNSKPIRFRTFTGNMNITTFASPDGSRDELWRLLLSANESIYLEIYGINNPYILDLIHSINDTSPEVDMKFLLGWNSLGYYSQNDYVANNLTLLGFPVKWTNSSDFTFAHQKFFIIDNKTTVVHSGNWAKTSFPEDGNKANREWSIAIEDDDVTNFYLSVFQNDWYRGTDYNATVHGTGTALTYSQSSSTYKRPFATQGEFSGTMSVTPIFGPETSLDGVLWCINQSRFTLDIQIPYFTNVGDAGAVDEIIDAILAAKDRGVTVRVISEEEKDWVDIEQILIGHGIPIVWHDTRWFTANHNKGVIVDGIIVLVSSINYSDNSITSNREAGVIVQHQGIAQWYQDVYDFDWEIADADAMEEVNLYWSPNIPTSSDTTNITVYAHGLYPNVEEVILSVRIGHGAWTNHTITANVFVSAEEDMENYFYELSPQTHGTYVTVQAYIRASGVWHTGLNMTIHVLDSANDYCSIDSPSDVKYEVGTTGHLVRWEPEALRPHKYMLYENESEVASGDWNGSALERSVDGLTSALYNYTLFVNDTVGNSAIDSVWVDVTPSEAPVFEESNAVEIEAGTQGTNVTWTVEDLNPSRYEIHRNNSLIREGLWDSSPANITISLDGLGFGVWNYTVFVNDTLGNSETDMVWVTVVDTVLPVIQDPPSDSSFEYGSSDNEMMWVVSDEAPERYEILHNGPIEKAGLLNDTSEIIHFDMDHFSFGVHNLTIIIYDLGGHETADMVIVTVLDTTGPTVSHPSDMLFEEGVSGQSITWTGSDLLPAEYVIYENGSITCSRLWNSSSESITYNLIGLTEGTYNYTIVLADLGGNMVLDTVLVTVTPQSVVTTTSTTEEPTLSDLVVFIAVGVIILVVVCIGGLKKRR